MSSLSNICPLCGNPFLEKDSQCDLCGGRDETIFGLHFGFVYPAEANIIRVFILSVVISVIIFIFIGYSLWTYFENHISALG